MENCWHCSQWRRRYNDASAGRMELIISIENKMQIIENRLCYISQAGEYSCVISFLKNYPFIYPAAVLGDHTVCECLCKVWEE
jgi:hypothetical protein